MCALMCVVRVMGGKMGLALLFQLCMVQALNRGELWAEPQHADDSKNQIMLSIKSIPRSPKIQTSLKANCKQHHLHVVSLDK